MPEENPKPSNPNKYYPHEEVIYKGMECVVGHFYLTDDYLGYCYELYSVDGNQMFPEVYEEELDKENKRRSNMLRLTTFFQDLLNAFNTKKSWYNYFCKFILAGIFGVLLNKTFPINVWTCTIGILIMLAIFTLFDYVMYRMNVGNCLGKLDDMIIESKQAFLDNQYFKDDNGVPFNVYKLYFMERKTHFQFYLLEYGRNSDEIWNFWLNNENVHKKYSLYKVELIKKRRPEEKNE